MRSHEVRADELERFGLRDQRTLDDGKTELLLEVMGERSRWMAIVEELDNEWTRTFEDACGAAAAPAPDPPPS